ncbi:ABC transporter permease [Viridibacillus arvi]|uniref:ABC transporter permease n=1 Tax=Viridibacillus arvi TaxID=263475 RepID=UPI00187B9AEA|nr:ABC transporter permease [Viridibacillus sp. JNUCC-6]QOV11184.1 ABC transporter permease [Viridibacillus sp. JNUCC-6]
MTLFNLAKKNIKGNINNYLLYFFSMVVCIIIFYTFNSLLYIPEIQNTDPYLESTMSQTSFILIGFIIVFIGYSNAFFTKKRKKEVGLYSLLGVKKKTIGRMLFFENIIIGAITLLTGLVLGIILSRLSTMLLLKLLGAPIEVSFSIPLKAILTTTLIFTIIIIFTSVQSYFLIYRFRLIELFHAEKKGEKVPKASLLSAGLAFVLLTSSYWLMFNGMAMLAIPLVVIGTYLLFRSLTVYLLKRAQKKKAKYYHGINIIGTSHLLYRVRGNALMLTIIALLITGALPYIQAAFSEYAMTEKDARDSAPFSYIYLSKDEAIDKQINRIIANDKNHPIIEQLDIPIISLKGTTTAPFEDNNNLSINLMAEQTYHQVKKTLDLGDIPPLSDEQAIAFKYYFIHQPTANFKGHDIEIPLPPGKQTLTLKKLEKKSVRLTDGEEPLYLIVDDKMFSEMAEQINPITYKAYEVENEKTTKETSETLQKLSDENMQLLTYYDKYTTIKALTGMKMFIVSSLALVLLAATGSIIYFKQISEAHADRNRYEILRKIGVSKKEVRSTIAKQTLFVFILPLLIGILNGGMLLLSIVVAYDMDLIGNTLYFLYAVAAYGTIYLIYYGLTITSYNRIVNK